MVVWLYVGFIAFVLAMLALDLGVLNRRAHVVGAREALAWSAGWIALGLLFAVLVYYAYEGQWLGLGRGVDPADGRINDGVTATTKYLTGYIVEKSLSLDNIFVIAMIFAFFGVPAMYQHRVLFWGILGALVLRGVMIGVGAQLVAAFHWVLYIFGAFLVVTAVKMLWLSNEPSDPHRNPVVRLARRVLPVTDGFHGEHFLVRAGSAQSAEAATPAEFLRRLRSKAGIPHGRHNDYQSLAFTIYKVAYDFSRTKQDSPARTLFGQLSEFIFNRRELSLGDRFKLNFLRT